MHHILCARTATTGPGLLCGWRSLSALAVVPCGFFGRDFDGRGSADRGFEDEVQWTRFRGTWFRGTRLGRADVWRTRGLDHGGFRGGDMASTVALAVPRRRSSGGFAAAWWFHGGVWRWHAMRWRRPRGRGLGKLCPRIIQQSAGGTAGSNAVRSFSFVRKRFLAVGNNFLAIPQTVTARAESCLSGSAEMARRS